MHLPIAKWLTVVSTEKKGGTPRPTLPCPVNKYFSIALRKGKNREVLAEQNVHETHLTRTQNPIFSPQLFPQTVIQFE